MGCSYKKANLIILTNSETNLIDLHVKEKAFQMASRLASVSKNIFGKAFYSNLWIAISFGLISQVIGYTKYEGYFDLYWIIMKDGYLYFNLYPSFDELSAILFIRVFLAVFVFLTVKDKLKGN